MLALAVADAIRPIGVRGKGRLFRRFVPRSGIVSTNYAGYRLSLDLADEIQWQMAVGCYEHDETRLMQRLVGSGMTVLDVGANVGHFTLIAARRVGPTGRVVSLEPYPYAAERLERTVAENGIRQVRVVRLALSDVSGASRMAEALASNHTPSLLDDAPDREYFPVTLARLDEVLDDLVGPQTPIDFMKVDVEGGEPALVRGAQQAFRSGRVRRLLMEFNAPWLERAGSSPDALASDLRSAGFVLRSAWPDFATSDTATLCFEHRPVA